MDNEQKEFPNTVLLIGDGYTIAADDDNCCLRIVKTGWKGRYHVIIEDAVYGSKMLPEPLTLEQIESKYGHKLPAEPLNLQQKVKQIPNDYDLGGAVRSFYKKLH